MFLIFKRLWKDYMFLQVNFVYFKRFLGVLSFLAVKLRGPQDLKKKKL